MAGYWGAKACTHLGVADLPPTVRRTPAQHVSTLSTFVHICPHCSINVNNISNILRYLYRATHLVTDMPHNHKKKTWLYTAKYRGARAPYTLLDSSRRAHSNELPELPPVPLPFRSLFCFW